MDFLLGVEILREAKDLMIPILGLLQCHGYKNWYLVLGCTPCLQGIQGDQGVAGPQGLPGTTSWIGLTEASVFSKNNRKMACI